MRVGKLNGGNLHALTRDAAKSVARIANFILDGCGGWSARFDACDR